MHTWYQQHHQQLIPTGLKSILPPSSSSSSSNSSQNTPAARATSISCRGVPGAGQSLQNGGEQSSRKKPGSSSSSEVDLGTNFLRQVRAPVLPAGVEVELSEMLTGMQHNPCFSSGSSSRDERTQHISGGTAKQQQQQQQDSSPEGQKRQLQHCSVWQQLMSCPVSGLLAYPLTCLSCGDRWDEWPPGMIWSRHIFSN